MGPFTDVFRLEVSHLFHTQTPSNWIVNLWWQLIIRPSSEVLMRSYFSWLTSPQITSGDSSFWVWISFRASPLAGGIKVALWCFAGPVNGFRLVKSTANVPNQKLRKPLFSHLKLFKVGQLTKILFFIYKLVKTCYFRCSTVCFTAILWYWNALHLIITPYLGYKISFLVSLGWLSSNHHMREKKKKMDVTSRFFRAGTRTLSLN